MFGVRGKPYGEHGLLSGKLGDLGIEILTLFRREEAVDIALPGADDICDGALEGTCHAAQAGGDHFGHGWDVMVGLEACLKCERYVI